uniref:Uncharacterized protein n=1 Tax=Salix viminalis TaxID=40686 RepID=A0A6N2M2F0_SALVM
MDAFTLGRPAIEKYFEMVKGNSRITDDSEGANKKKKDEEPGNSSAVSSNTLLQNLKQIMNVAEKSDADNFLRLSILFTFKICFFSSNNI